MSINLEVDGIRIHAVAEGSGEPVVFLHGWGATWKFWRPAMAALSPRYRCIAVDWPGFGESDKPDAPYTIEWYAGLLGGILDALGVPAAALVGHSMGGAAAATFALARPERVRKLVLVNALVQGPTAFSRLKRFACLPVVRSLVWILAHVRWIRRLSARIFTFHVALDPEYVDDAMRGTYDSMFRSIASMRATDLAPRLGEFRMPVQVINTDKDGIFLPTQRELQCSLVRGADVSILPDTGHCPMVERPEAFSAHLLAFLARDYETTASSITPAA